MDLNGRSALVTGGAGGLGGATVRRLAELGVGVAVFDRDADRAGELAKELGDGVVAAGDGPGGTQQIVRDHRAGQPGAVGGEEP